MTPAAASSADRGPERRLTLPRSHRLKRRRLIRALFDRDRDDVQFVASGSLRALYRLAQPSEVGAATTIQVGVFVGRRVGGAVQRNRMRRRIREAYRRRHPDMVSRLEGRTDTLTLGLVFRGEPGIGWQQIVQDTDGIVDKLLSRL